MIAGNANAEDPVVTAVKKEVVSGYSWGYQVGVKQQHGSYKNGRSLHAISRRSGTTGTNGSPDYLVWVDEHTGQTAALERPVGYAELGKNPATSAVFTSDAPEGEQGRIWWVLGGRANLQPFDMVRSDHLFNPFAWDLVLDNFVTDFESTTPCLATVGLTGMLAYRWLESRAPNGEVRFQDYDLSQSIPILRTEKALGQTSFVSPYGDVTIEQVWSRWDPRHRAFAVSWQWFIRPFGTNQGQRFGSNPFLFTEDLGATWLLADRSPATLPLMHATVTPTMTPHDHLALGEDTNWFQRDLGFSPSGVPWITMPSGAIDPRSNGWQLTFFRWNQSAWEGVPLSNDMQAGADAISCGPTRDFLVCAYSEFGNPGALLVKVSRDDGQTWSAPVTVDTVGTATNGSAQRISWVSFAQPADRYLDNSARFFVAFYRESDSGGMLYKNRIRWVRVQVGPCADFNGDEIANDSDLADFTAAHSAGDWRADFNDDGIVDELDLAAFNTALEGGDSCGEDPGGGDPGGEGEAFVQAAYGLVSIEAEHFEQPPTGWSLTSLAGASNSEGIKATSGPKTPVADLSQRAEYRINFSRTGPHSVWLGMRASASGQKVLRVGLDDGTPLSRTTTIDGIWRWKLVSSPINVQTTGVHVLRIYRKEPNVELDKIVLTPGTFKPTGSGPPESPRQ